MRVSYLHSPTQVTNPLLSQAQKATARPPPSRDPVSNHHQQKQPLHHPTQAGTKACPHVPTPLPSTVPPIQPLASRLKNTARPRR